MIDKFQKDTILTAAKRWFETVIAPNHISNTKKLSNPSAFHINPFLIKYLARYLTGSCDAISIAKALVYPRVLQTSITTSFGTNAQKFVVDVLGSFGSTTPGIDIEFIDQIDGRKKYCQVKLGPNTINKDDVETINRHFTLVKNLARTNNLKLEYNDLIVGVLYGEPSQLSTHYKNIEKKFHVPVYIGQEFWQRITGSDCFYSELSSSIGHVALKYDGSALLEETILKLSMTPEIQALADNRSPTC